MLIILGKTASGKDLTVNELISKYGFKKLITYTTRPMRKNEKQDVTYHFISEEEFQQKVDKNFFAEWKSYETIEGVWYYGTSLEDLSNADNNTVIILTPNGYRDIVKKLSNKHKSVYIYANNSTIKERLISRGDDKEEAERRLNHDNVDFEGIEKEVDFMVCNNNDTNIKKVVSEILAYYA